MEKAKLNTNVINEKTFLRKSFLVAGIGFFSICLIGLIVNFIVDGSGILKEELDSSSRFNFSMYKKMKLAGALSRLARISVFGMGLIVISTVLNLVWAFRALKASKGFIYTTFSIYVLSQGIGFGTLFLTWKAIDLIAVFGIASAMFLIMATIGYTSKNLLPLGKWLIIGSLFAFVFGIIGVILYLAGAYSETFSLIIYSLFGFLVLGWIAFDVWSIKRTSQYAASVGGFDEVIEFRLIMWSGFKLLSDFVALIWIIAHFYQRSR